MVEILLSTYNGEKFLKDFLASLEAQTCEDWFLTVRDDGSKDNTMAILRKFADKYPDKVLLIENKEGNLGACKSFLILLRKASADYIMFADQDDVWLREKIEKTLKKIKTAEEKYGKEIPILIHTDLKVVDERLNPVSESFWQYQRQNPEHKTLNFLIVQNNVTGCTMVINKALKNLVEIIPERAIMHDWWLALVASAFGLIEYISEPTILYRQHHSQNTGAKKYSVKYFFERFIKTPEEAFNAVQKTLAQAQEFLKIYESKLTPSQKEMLLNYINLPYLKTSERIKEIRRWKLFKQGFLRNIGFICICLLLRGQSHVST